MKIRVYSSGSKGNCTLISINGTNLLVDVGICKKSIVENLAKDNLSLSDVSAIFLTHEHVDHTCAIPQLLKEDGIVIFTTFGTMSALREYYVIKGKEKIVNLIDSKVANGTIVYINRMENSYLYQSVYINGLSVDVLPTFHDAKEPIGFVFYEENKKLVYITDTGYVHKDLYPIISNADCYILESNHDPEILMHSDRPYHLKIRIISDHGHMSNIDSMITLANVIGVNTKLIMHAHISEECNLSQIVELTRKKVFDEYGLYYDNIEFVILEPRCTKEYLV